MEKTNFWNDAARYGVIMALVAIVFDTLGFYTQHALLSLASLVLFLLLLTTFTKLRAARYGARGYSYGKCLGFMVGMMLCAGFIEGAYMSAAANWLFASKYDVMLGQQIAALENTGIYTADQLDLMARWMRSPLVLIFASMLGSAIKGGFFGLFIAAFARRDAAVFVEGADPDREDRTDAGNRGNTGNE